MPHSALRDGPADARLAAVEQELQGFSYIVSHDLAASFRHVAEFSRLLEDEPGPVLSDGQHAHVAQIRAATNKCQLMMEQLLVFSRTQRSVLSKVRQDMTPTLRLAMLQLSAEIKDAGAEVQVGSLGEACADLELLGLAARHMLDNAIKFRRPNVRPRITVQALQDEVFWRLRITDNGIGVDPAYREKAFRMFHHLNAEGAYPGVGAGLAIVRRVARRHGGEAAFIACAEGACIELALPRARTAQ